MAAGTALNASAASARAAEANWIADRMFNLQGVSGEVDTGSREDALEQKPLLNFRRGRIAGALVVDPAYFQIVALLAALEAELDVGIL